MKPNNIKPNNTKHMNAALSTFNANRLYLKKTDALNIYAKKSNVPTKTDISNLYVSDITWSGINGYSSELLTNTIKQYSDDNVSLFDNNSTSISIGNNCSYGISIGNNCSNSINIGNNCLYGISIGENCVGIFDIGYNCSQITLGYAISGGSCDVATNLTNGTLRLGYELTNSTLSIGDSMTSSSFSICDTISGSSISICSNADSSVIEFGNYSKSTNMLIGCGTDGGTISIGTSGTNDYIKLGSSTMIGNTTIEVGDSMVLYLGSNTNGNICIGNDYIPNSSSGNILIGSNSSTTKLYGGLQFENFMTTQNIQSNTFDTIYQNTNTTPMFISISFTVSVEGEIFEIYSDSSESPTTVISNTSGTTKCNITFIVLPLYYYKVIRSNDGIIDYWTEWS